MEKNIKADPECEICSGTGVVTDVLEGQSETCLCVVEKKKELETDTQTEY